MMITISFLIISSYWSTIVASPYTHEKLTHIFEGYFKNINHYGIHITACKIDPNLFVVGLEWGAARQKLSVVKLDDQGQVLWESKFRHDELPGYISSVKQISVKGFSNPLFEVIAGERGIYFYYLYELEDQKLKKIKLHKTSDPIALYRPLSPK